MTPDRRYQPRPLLTPEQVEAIIGLLERLVEALEKGNKP